MIYIRSAFFLSILAVFTILFAVSCLLFFPFLSLIVRYNYTRFWNKTVMLMLRVFCNIHYEIKGLEYITKMMNEPVILLSKHQSAWETIAFIAIFPKQFCFVLKKELLHIPFFGWVLGMLGMIHIDRSKSDKAALMVAEQGRKRLADGRWIIIYPEGTRIAVGEFLPYKKGGSRLAVDTKAYILPIAHNAGHVWPKGSFLKYPGTVTVSIGPPISTKDKVANIVHREVETWIEAEMHQIDRASYSAEALAKRVAQSK